MTGNEEAEGPSVPVIGDGAVSLSLVIPAYNEASRFQEGVRRLRTAIEAGAVAPGSTEFVVVDDGSADDTTTVARALFASFPHVRHVRLPENRGKGGAVRAGVSVAVAPLIAFADADMAIDPAQTPQFVDALARYDLAIGARAATGSSVDRTSLKRSIMNRAFNQLVNALTHVSLADTQCGFKAFRAPAAKLLFHCSVTERFAFDVEILSLARRFGLPIAEIPVQWLRVKGSRIRPWTDARSMARDVYRAGRSENAGPPVPTLAVKLPAGGNGSDDIAALPALRSGLAPGLTILGGGERFRVLCPLTTEPEIEMVAMRIGTLCSGAAIERTTTTVAQLCTLAPLSTSGDSPPAGIVPCPTPSIAGKRLRD